ncbi:tRNA epoxyqueuosine(34) reductase QueG [Immundisolibacter sp.]|uniref:tRNA epoxyqueuosine(34) reductase QueG n=1 Tax=Immundisolibacter sp. TaxID=1934948 RepID=UPI00356B3157
MTSPTPAELLSLVRDLAADLGFAEVGVSGVELAHAPQRLSAWLARGYHGEMAWMARHGEKRWRPDALVPGTVRVISVRMDYWPAGAAAPWPVLGDPALGYVSRYALGRDYHKRVRQRLQRLADGIVERVGPFGYRVFCDSAPVLEKPLAEQAGLGWIGKHTCLIDRRAGSWFFLGELYTDLPLPVDAPATGHCGSCRACLDVCPTGAIVAPYVLDARRCISYLTIEHPGPIPEPLRPLLGNRIYGCDDCQLVCPWNKFARVSEAADFAPRHGLDAPRLTELMDWTAAEFERRLEGSAIRRIGHERWQRNLAVALGNAPPGDGDAVACLRRHLDNASSLVREHVAWALRQHGV